MKSEKITLAQKLILSFFGPTGRNPAHGYKAPHAPMPTPERPHHSRRPPMVFSKAHDALIYVRRPFKGFRK